MRILERLRAEGWTVAVHNDYRLSGRAMTFWLLVHPCGLSVKGEGVTDDEALGEAERRASEMSPQLKVLSVLAAADSPAVVADLMVRSVEAHG